MFLPLVWLNFATSSSSAVALALVWLCQKVTVTGSPNLTAGAAPLLPCAGPHAASAGSTAAALAPAADARRNERRETAIWIETPSLPYMPLLTDKHYPLSPVRAMPSTKYFCARRKMTTVGRITSVDAAIKSAYLPPASV